MMKDTFISKVFLSNRIVGNNFNCRFVIISVFKCFLIRFEELTMTNKSI